MNPALRLERYSIPIAVILAGGIFFVDLSLPLGVAAVASVLTVGYRYSPEGGGPWMVMTNRGLALLAKVDHCLAET